MKKLILFVILICSLINKQGISQSFDAKTLIWLQLENLNDSLNINIIDSNILNLHVYIAGNIASSIPKDTNTLAYLNYNPALNFNTNTIEGFNIPLKLKGKNSKTLFIVSQVKDTKNENAVWTYQLNSKKIVGLTSQELITMNKTYKYADKNLIHPFINTIVFTVNENISDSTAGFYFGKNDSLGFDGLIAEILLFDTHLKGDELIKWQTYLAIKYGITLNEIDYMDGKGNVIWENNSNYTQSIAGIGKDTLYGLNQKQSYSTSDEDCIKIGAGNIDSTNIKNNYPLKQGQFIIWANNGYAVQIEYDTANVIYDTTDYMYYSLLSRKWLLKTSGTNSNTISTQLIFDGSKLNVTSTDEFYLIVDHSATDDFFPENAVLFLPDSITDNGLVYFNNLLWDTDESGSDMFTFSFPKNFYANPQNEQILSVSNNPRNSDNKKADENNGNGITYHLYPNPTPGKYILDVITDTKTDFEVKLLDVNGRMIKTFRKNYSDYYKIEDELSDKGMYFLEVRSAYELRVFKMIMK